MSEIWGVAFEETGDGVGQVFYHFWDHLLGVLDVGSPQGFLVVRGLDVDEEIYVEEVLWVRGGCGEDGLFFLFFFFLFLVMFFYFEVVFVIFTQSFLKGILIVISNSILAFEKYFSNHI